MEKPVPFVDLRAQLDTLRPEIMTAINGVLDSTQFIMGNELREFEKEFAAYCGTKLSLGVASGLDALHIAMRALNIGPGDEVLLPANTFIATALGVSHAGATPVLVDMDPKTYLMNANDAMNRVSKRTKAILPVHLYGRCMDLLSLKDFCKNHELALVEDAAQAHGSRVGNTRAGNFGDIACFSFYPGKNLGAYGDGGGLTTNRQDLKEASESLRNYGSPQKYHHPIIGYNSRLDTIQAAILRVKLRHLDQANAKRFEAAQRYTKLLAGVGDLGLPEIPDHGSHVFHLFVVRTSRRDAMVEFLNKNGVGSVIHYPTPVHLHGAYASLNYKKGDFPHSEKASQEIFSLPLFPEITPSQQEQVAETVKRFFKG